MKTQAVSRLFIGRPHNSKEGLSNEDDLAKACPPQFKDSNPWSDYAMRLSPTLKDQNIATWKWKSNDQSKRKRQMICFHGVLSTFGLPYEDRKAVLGWMLSEMLTEVPMYLSDKHN